MSERILRINELIKQKLSQIILTEIELPEGCLATITVVDTGKDLHNTTVWVSVLPAKKAVAVIRKLNGSLKHLQYLLMKCLSMRPIPRLYFKIDDSEAEAAKVDDILDKLKI